MGIFGVRVDVQGSAVYRTVARRFSMPFLIDHVFVLTAPGAPAADRLVELGFPEGAPNRHPGQGTACRRFFFRNGMLEFLWVEDVVEARSGPGRGLQLWERWSCAGTHSSPFGIILRQPPGSKMAYPFRSWIYQPQSMPGLTLEISSESSFEEPFWGFLPNAPSREYPADGREVTGIRVACPALPAMSLTQRMADAGVIGIETALAHVLEVEFDGGAKGELADLRPDLPVICRW